MLLIISPSFRSFYSSETERDFSLDFLVTVEFLEAALYRPYFETGTELLMGFPHRLLTDQDHIVLTSNFNIQEKALMTSVKLVSETNKLTGMILSYNMHEKINESQSDKQL